jgi:site-specific DNA recombinase
MSAAQSRREVLRARHRVLSAMRAQVLKQGRHPGGRPPYGYRLVDAGPHPNHAHAVWGRRQYRLDPDPVTATHVQWMFAERLAGASVASIVRSLNERAVPWAVWAMVASSENMGSLRPASVRWWVM